MHAARKEVQVVHIFFFIVGKASRVFLSEWNVVKIWYLG